MQMQCLRWWQQQRSDEWFGRNWLESSSARKEVVPGTGGGLSNFEALAGCTQNHSPGRCGCLGRDWRGPLPVTRTSDLWRTGEGLGLWSGTGGQCQKEGRDAFFSISVVSRTSDSWFNKQEGNSGWMLWKTSQWHGQPALWGRLPGMLRFLWVQRAVPPRVVRAQHRCGNLGQQLASRRCSVVLGNLLCGKHIHAAGNLLKVWLLLL